MRQGETEWTGGQAHVVPLVREQHDRPAAGPPSGDGREAPGHPRVPAPAPDLIGARHPHQEARGPQRAAEDPRRERGFAPEAVHGAHGGPPRRDARAGVVSPPLFCHPAHEAPTPRAGALPRGAAADAEDAERAGLRRGRGLLEDVRDRQRARAVQRHRAAARHIHERGGDADPAHAALRPVAERGRTLDRLGASGRAARGDRLPPVCAGRVWVCEGDILAQVRTCVCSELRQEVC
mmetsp:Transcript_33461/g.93889  ORF Transcript_33461/g.93889 Transcript_33461/m.93889 type:complete len:236 (+) Transcript_33461:390-1097(+)